MDREYPTAMKGEGLVGENSASESGSDDMDTGVDTRSASASDVQQISATEREELRHLLQGHVASAAAAKLATRPELWLEHDEALAKCAHALRKLLLGHETTQHQVLEYLYFHLPKSAPGYARIFLLEAVIRMLGRQWSTDECDMADVVVASGRVKMALYRLAQEARQPIQRHDPPIATLTYPKGEQHLLMLDVLNVLLVSLGWKTHLVCGDELTRHGLDELKKSELVFVSWNNTNLSDHMQRMLRAIRRAHPQRSKPIMVGGSSAEQSVDFLIGLGVDCICDSVYSAAGIAENFLQLKKSRSRNGFAVPGGVLPKIYIDWFGR